MCAPVHLALSGRPTLRLHLQASQGGGQRGQGTGKEPLGWAPQLLLTGARSFGIPYTSERGPFSSVPPPSRGEAGPLP